MNVPINAIFSLVDPSSQEKIPPLIPLKAGGYSEDTKRQRRQDHRILFSCPPSRTDSDGVGNEQGVIEKGKRIVSES